jgi:hypothetical protein
MMPEIENVYEAARIADCPRTPDGGDKEAVDFLQSCIDSGDELYREAAKEQLSDDEVQDRIHEYSDQLIPIYTNELWWGWVELGGFRSENDLYRAQGDFDPEQDMDTVPQADFYMWARNILSWRVQEMV